MATPTVTTIATLRRMVAEPTETTYTDALLATTLELYPLPDSTGLDPEATLWAGAWDLNRAAADIWNEKAAAVAANFDFQADGGNYSRSQMYTQYTALAKSFAAKRQAGSVPLIVTPKPRGANWGNAWLGNQSEAAIEGSTSGATDVDWGWES